MIYLGFSAAILTTLSFIPQVIQIWRTNDTKAISLYMFLLFTTGVLCWLVYGFLRNDVAITVANLITLIFSTYILYKKIKNRD